MKERENKLGLTPRLLRSHTQESNRTQVSRPRRVIKHIQEGRRFQEIIEMFQKILGRRFQDIIEMF